MKAIDFIFALVCGWMLNWVTFDILKGFGIDFGLWRWLLSWVLPLASLVCLWLAYLIGKKMVFVFQAAKHILVGAFATVVDLKVFEALVLLFTSFAGISIILKGISFLLSTSLKYWGNKHWAFSAPGGSASGGEEFEKEPLLKEVAAFFSVTIVGLILDIGLFFYFSKIMGPQFGVTLHIWTEFSVIFAALIAAIWNFLGYKFLVFKK